jgi:carbon-monoxide dehydrogenase large subunit
MVHDSGTVLNPLIVAGQVQGAIAQGIGQAFYEHLPYDASGQPLARSFMDYLIGTAAEIPRIRLDHTTTPAPHIPGGMKGVGEGGIMGPPAAVANAVEDALRSLGVKFTALPVTPERILAALRDAARSCPPASRQATQDIDRASVPDARTRAAPDRAPAPAR